jgi:hypothetical protein
MKLTDVWRARHGAVRPLPCSTYGSNGLDRPSAKSLGALVGIEELEGEHPSRHYTVFGDRDPTRLRGNDPLMGHDNGRDLAQTEHLSTILQVV